MPAVCKAAGVLLAHHSVHEPVDDLCKKSASLWARGEMLGIAAASRDCGRSFTWEKSIHTLCTKGEIKLSTQPAAMVDKKAECLPKVDLVVMWAPGS